MTTKVNISDGSGTNNNAKVTSRGQLVVAPLEFSKMYNAQVDATCTAFNLTPPETKQQFVITDIILHANKSVGVNDATVVLYEASAVDTLTEDTVIIEQEMLKQSTLSLTGLNIIISEGKWVNIKTNDATIFANIGGYYIDTLS